jgi:putative ABC transport system ATP-binding protein
VTGEEIMDVLSGLNEQGQTIVLVTHENYIAAFAKRQVHLKDGLIEKDFINHHVGAEV